MLFVNLDLSAIAALGSGLEGATKKALAQFVPLLVAQTRARIVEQTATRLHTRRSMYVEALHHFQESPNIWIVQLDAKATWIESGMPAHSMLDDLLKGKNVKRAEDGSTYVVVPFEHKGGSTQMTPAQMTLTETLKATMKQKKIPYGAIEKDSNGSPKLGLLHRFDIMDKPQKTLGPWGGSSLGHGAVGEVQQGPTGIPFLQGVNVYQREVTDKTGAKSVKKSIVTFRIASSKHRGQGRWEHPGVDAVNLFPEAAEWAAGQWSKEIVPQILDAIQSSL